MAGGRPYKEIDQKNFEQLCALQCTLNEFCFFFDTTDKTLDTWCVRTYNMCFSDVYAIKRGAGKISLRRTQFQMAEKYPAMAIWLGKQYLGQSEARPEQVSETAKNISTLIEALHGVAPDVWKSDETADV